MREFERIVEFCFIEKEQRFVVRFLDGSSYSLPISDLPKKLQTKKSEWNESTLSDDRDSILVKAGKDIHQIPAHIIHARGTIL